MAQIVQPQKDKKNIILLCILAAILIAAGVCGYLFIRHGVNGWNLNVNNTNNPSIPLEEEPVENGGSEGPTDSQTFKIPELGIQMTLPEGLEGLEYEADLVSEPYEGFVSLGTKQLDEANDSSSYCTVVNAPLGTLARYKYNPKDSAVASGPKEVFRLDNGDYIAFTHPQQGCTANESLGNLQDEQVKLLEKNLYTIIELR